VIVCQAAMGLGTLMGGWKIIHTMGSKITRLQPVGGFAAETAGAVSLFTATALGVPVSTTHTITGAIIGVGSTRRCGTIARPPNRSPQLHSRMNSFFVLLGIETWKPILTALLLPPVPLLLLVLVGAWLLSARRRLGWPVLLGGLGLLWLTASHAPAQWFAQVALSVPPALTAERIRELKGEAAGKRPFAIVVLGGGVEALAPEYGTSNLQPLSMERLRYGLWLARQTGAPVAFSGGVGHAQRESPSEAEVAARIAAQEFGRPLKWVEDQSRDTRENAARSVALLKRTGIDHIVLVTTGLHMPRALRAFREAAGSTMRVEAAPISLARNTEVTLLGWLPSNAGFTQMRYALRELFGLWAGA